MVLRFARIPVHLNRKWCKRRAQKLERTDNWQNQSCELSEKCAYPTCFGPADLRMSYDVGYRHVQSGNRMRTESRPSRQTKETARISVKIVNGSWKEIRCNPKGVMWSLLGYLTTQVVLVRHTIYDMDGPQRAMMDPILAVETLKLARWLFHLLVRELHVFLRTRMEK